MSSVSAASIILSQQRSDFLSSFFASEASIYFSRRAKTMSSVSSASILVFLLLPFSSLISYCRFVLLTRGILFFL
jgi:hypothetical protein